MTRHWKERPEGGGRFAIWLIRGIARYGGRTLARLCLYPITLYFVAVRGPERTASRAYLARALGRPARLSDAFRHMHTFASTILDRVFLLGGRLGNFDVTVSGLDAVHHELDKRRGLLLFGSHLGSFEVLRVLARQRPDYVIRVVLDKAHNAVMTQLLDALNPEIAARVIDAGQDGPSVAMAIKQATDDGELVALLVDRAPPRRAVAAGAVPGPPRAVPDRAVADRLGLESAGGARVRPVPRRQPLRPRVRSVQRRFRHSAPATRAGAVRAHPALCRAPRTSCAQRPVQLVQLLRFLDAR